MLSRSPRPGLQVPHSMIGKGEEISKPARGRDQATKASCNLPELEAAGVCNHETVAIFEISTCRWQQ